MTKRILPTPEQLRELLRYEPDTGKLFWKPRPEDSFATTRAARSWNSRYAWQEAFLNLSPAGYRKSFVKNINMSAHRVAWAIYYGEWPEGSIDFINNVKKDVRIANLRNATNSQVNTNKILSPRGSSRFRGVSNRGAGKWVAAITVNRKKLHLGTFKSEEDAHAAYCEGAKKYHGEFARTE